MSNEDFQTIKQRLEEGVYGGINLSAVSMLVDEIERLRGALEQVKSVFDDSEISDMDYALESYKIVCEALEGETK